MLSCVQPKSHCARNGIGFCDGGFCTATQKVVNKWCSFHLGNGRNRDSGIPGDGRCLFRSVVHGACLRTGKPSPSEGHQKELADELRAKVVDEFIKRRADTEWFLEGDFDTYVVQMRQPHIWGGEPELLMASDVLQMPITVYMKDKISGGLKIIAEYGQEYGKDNPVRVLYHGYGHYDALRGGAEPKQFKKS